MDEDGYFRCNSWFCYELQDGFKCDLWHTSLANCVEEFTARDNEWYKNIEWTELFDHIYTNTDSLDEFCDCYHILDKALNELPTDAKDEQGTIFRGIPLYFRSKYMNIKAGYLQKLDNLTSLVNNNPPKKVAFDLCGIILANEVYHMQRYSTLHH